MKPLCSAARANLLAHESEGAMLQINDYPGAEQMDYGAWLVSSADPPHEFPLTNYFRILYE
jgi:hypothetical protein